MRCKYFYFSRIGGLWWYFNGILVEIVYPLLLHRSDLIFAQHQGQKNILDKKKIKSVVLPNLIELNEIPTILNPLRKEFIYVGALDKRKGFIEFYKLVKKTPLLKYKIIGQPRDKTGYLYCEILKSLIVTKSDSFFNLHFTNGRLPQYLY